jgi:hypothetical protein
MAAPPAQRDYVEYRPCAGTPSPAHRADERVSLFERVHTLGSSSWTTPFDRAFVALPRCVDERGQ